MTPAQTRELEEATQWLLRLRDESVTEQDLGDWLAWYERDERNKRAFDEMQDLWRMTGALAPRLRIMELPPSEPASLRRLIGAAIAAPVAIAIGIAAWMGLSRPPAETPVAVQQAPLPDGSHIDLAAKTTVDVHYSADQRLLEMSSGEAFFTVAPNHQRPFIVKVGDVRVRAVGTAFNIRRADQRTVVTVTDGVVDVLSDRGDVALAQVRAGNALTMASAAAAPTVAPVDAARALAWRSGRLEYVNEPLAAVLADVARYASRPVRIGDESIGRLTFTGTVFTDSTEAWLQALPATFPVEVVTHRDERLIVRAAR